VTGGGDDDDDIKDEERNKRMKTGRKERILLRRDSSILKIMLRQRLISWSCRSSVMQIIDMHTIYLYRTSKLSQHSDFLYYISTFSAQGHLTSLHTY
jgi:hypothetical protein